MSDVEKKIAGDWFEIRSIMDTPVEFDEFFRLPLDELTGLRDRLRLAVDAGVVEVKRAVLGSIEGFVESQSFDARAFSDIAKHRSQVWACIYLTLLERGFAHGSINRRRAEHTVSGAPEEPGAEVDLKAIVADVEQRIAKKPDLRKNGAVKNILMQVSYYRRELENMKQLAPNIPKEKAQSFTENFKRTFADIRKKTQESYLELLRQEEPPAPAPVTNILDQYDLSPMTPLFADQARELSRIHSTLAFAEKERYKTRAILQPLGERLRAARGLVDRELAQYEHIAFSRGAQLARAFTLEVGEYITRKLSRA